MSESVHLRVHSEFSLADSIIRMDALAARYDTLSHKAIALTDEANLFGMIKFYSAMQKAGIHAIIGCDFWLAVDGGFVRVSLYAQHRQGYQNLCALASRAWQSPARYRTVGVLDEATLVAHAESLLLLFGPALESIPTYARIAPLHRAFGDRFYVALQRLGFKGEAAWLDFAVNTAMEENIPPVATNLVCFLEAADYPVHQARLAIYHGLTVEDSKLNAYHREGQYLLTDDEMRARFADLTVAVDNTNIIAERCHFTPRLNRLHMPTFTPGMGADTGDDLAKTHKADARGYFYALAENGLARHLAAHPSITDPAPYTARLAYECKVIDDMGFIGYFLIVADFIRWSKQHHIPVGLGRGSGAGSLVAFCLGITGIDPLRFQLLFERFLNPERKSMPDFDIDFCVDQRDAVIDYVSATYGAECVCQIVTFGHLAAKLVVRDAARVKGLPYMVGDRIAKAIPRELDITLDAALEKSDALQSLYARDEEREVIDLARRLEGLVRNVGTHAGGVVISPRPLTELMPLYQDEPSSSGQANALSTTTTATTTHAIAQFDKDDLERAGFLKFDFLGLRTLTIIDHAVGHINAHLTEAGLTEPLNIDELDFDEPRVFELLSAGNTTGVFQLESRGMRQYLKKLQPTSLNDIVAMVALYRPGPLENGIPEKYIRIRHGEEDVYYLHPKLEPILRETHGLMVYQEQIMQIAQALAEFSLAKADNLRKAMGKKNSAEMLAQKTDFIEGSVQHAGLSLRQAERLFENIEKFSKYCFNKSHSVGYAILAYQTAWLKVRYPAAFFAAAMSADMSFKNLDNLHREAISQGIRFVAPDINRSEAAFQVVWPDTVVWSLGAIKGVGQSVVAAIVAARKLGAFESFLDVLKRVDKLNSASIEALIASGALDSLLDNAPFARCDLTYNLKDTHAHAQKARNDKSAGLADLFSEVIPETETIAYTENPTLPTISEQCAAAHAVLGVHIAWHPCELVKAELASYGIAPLSVAMAKHNKGTGYALLDDAVHHRATTERPFERMILTLSDRQGRFEATVRNNQALFESHHAGRFPLQRVYVCQYTAGQNERGDYLNVQSIAPLAKVRTERTSHLTLEVAEASLTRLQTLITAPTTDAPLSLSLALTVVRENGARIAYESTTTQHFDNDKLERLYTLPGITVSLSA